MLCPVVTRPCACLAGERPFVCLICLSAFTTKANCERHLKVHTDTLNGGCVDGGGQREPSWVGAGGLPFTPSWPFGPEPGPCLRSGAGRTPVLARAP